MVVTDGEAFAHQQAGHLARRVFAVGCVDRPFYLLLVDTIDRGGNLCGQECGLTSADAGGDHAQASGRLLLMDRHLGLGERRYEEAGCRCGKQ